MRQGQRREELMISWDIYRKIRAPVIVASLTFGSGVFWSFSWSKGRYLFKLDENPTLLLFDGLVFIVYCIWCVRYLSEMLRRAGYIDDQ